MMTLEQSSAHAFRACVLATTLESSLELHVLSPPVLDIGQCLYDGHVFGTWCEQLLVSSAFK